VGEFTCSFFQLNEKDTDTMDDRRIGDSLVRKKYPVHDNSCTENDARKKILLSKKRKKEMSC
jgi:hypothetical protein